MMTPPGARRRAGKSRRRLLVIAGTGLVGGATLGTVFSRAGYAHDDRDYSLTSREIACTRQWHGTALTQRDNNLYRNDYASWQHINSVMWSPTRQGCLGRYWIEAGLRNGRIEANVLAQSSGGQCPPGQTSCVAYARYWGDSHGPGTYERRWGYAKTPDGTNHHYQFWRSDYRTGNPADANLWDVYVDFNLVGVSKNQASNRIYGSDAGGESTLPLSEAHAQTFNMGALQAFFGGSWQSWSAAELNHVDHPCGSAPCMNGIHPSNDPAQWSWNIENP